MTSEADRTAELVTVDLVKKRIYVRLAGFLSVEDAEQVRAAYLRAIPRVGRGYTVATIFDSFKPGTPEVQEVFTSMIRLASEAGCSKAARVMMGSVLGALQLGRLSKTDANYPAQSFETIEEAEAWLDSDEE